MSKEDLTVGIVEMILSGRPEVSDESYERGYLSALKDVLDCLGFDQSSEAMQMVEANTPRLHNTMA